MWLQNPKTVHKLYIIQLCWTKNLFVVSGLFLAISGEIDGIRR